MREQRGAEDTVYPDPLLHSSASHTDILSSSSTEWTVQIFKKKKRSSRASLEREVIIGIYHESGEGARKGSDSVRSEMKEKVKCSKIKTHNLSSHASLERIVIIRAKHHCGRNKAGKENWEGVENEIRVDCVKGTKNISQVAKKEKSNVAVK